MNEPNWQKLDAPDSIFWQLSSEGDWRIDFRWRRRSTRLEDDDSLNFYRDSRQAANRVIGKALIFFSFFGFGFGWDCQAIEKSSNKASVGGSGVRYWKKSQRLLVYLLLKFALIGLDLIHFLSSWNETKTITVDALLINTLRSMEAFLITTG